MGGYFAEIGRGRLCELGRLGVEGWRNALLVNHWTSGCADPPGVTGFSLIDQGLVIGLNGVEQTATERDPTCESHQRKFASRTKRQFRWAVLGIRCRSA